jgi:hypothetical protein
MATAPSGVAGGSQLICAAAAMSASLSLMARILILIAVLFCRDGFCQNPRWSLPDKTPIPALADLDVRWEASLTNIPPKVSIYRLVPHHFSPTVISNVVALCDFSHATGLTGDKNVLRFKSAGGDRHLVVDSTSSVIYYETVERRYGPTNLAQGVPAMSELPRLATNLLDQVGISNADSDGYSEGEKFNYSEPLTEYFVGRETITNIAFRSIGFRRVVDEIPMLGGDSGRFTLGEGGHIIGIQLEWHDLARCESRPTLSTEQIISLLREGKAFQGVLPMNASPIDWNTARGVAIKKAILYYTGVTDLLFPYVDLSTTVDTGHGDVELRIECPIVDESKPVVMRAGSHD